MRRRHFLALLPAALCADTEEGFQSLFDGRSLAGWTIREGPASAFYVKDGAIVERGTHSTLMALQGVYASLYQKQLLEEELASA